MFELYGKAPKDSDYAVIHRQ